MSKPKHACMDVDPDQELRTLQEREVSSSNFDKHCDKAVPETIARSRTSSLTAHQAAVLSLQAPRASTDQRGVGLWPTWPEARSKDTLTNAGGVCLIQGLRQPRLAYQ